jgi:hypothetical protein
MVQQLLLAGLDLSSIWEKARARDRQKEVAGDKGQWGFVLQGMRPAVAQAAEWCQGAVLIKNNFSFFYASPNLSYPSGLSPSASSSTHQVQDFCRTGPGVK